ncbi:SDR family oxidoreductase [Bisgaard Taxon 10/6]|uniref:NADP-dependent 3-hydroxy acid dehydrogenase YdfG n=1 Tax=Exercitatus varius TaxID=67857 RepID=A0ABT6EQJ8_9PAST|nr:SDR family oxidoreductase [Exercitatus varius]MDG2945824.1 SDR family oxidoreductase [Exercitatus varius]
MTQTALITGASNGIGLEFAKIHAQKGGNVVLVARSEDKLAQLAQELESQYNVKVWVIAQDLAQPNAAQTIFETTEAQGITVDILINNAGVGEYGLFIEQDLQDKHNLIQINMTSLTDLTYLYLKGMVACKQGKILNVSSTAGFVPIPTQAIYSSSKAYVTTFSQAIAEEVRESGVTVTALCPGAVATGFVEAGNLQGSSAWKNAQSAKSVAECGYQAMMRGELVAFNEGKLKFMFNWIMPFMPRSFILKMTKQAMAK